MLETLEKRIRDNYHALRRASEKQQPELARRLVYSMFEYTIVADTREISSNTQK